MKKQEIKEMDVAGLGQLESDLRTEYSQLKRAVREGTEKNNSRLKQMRREIARVKTVQKLKGVE